MRDELISKWRCRMWGASILAISAGLPAQAQTAGSPPPALEEIKITAEKVTTNLQKTPISVTALTSSTLAQSNLRTVQGLDGYVPGLVVASSGPDPTNVSIRGVGFEGFQNNSAKPGVSYNENGVYIVDPLSLSSNFLDLDQLEVLRGPQGTVLGQNSDGGAINITTVKPVLDKFSGDAEMTYGSYNLVGSRADLNIPLGTTMALRAAFQSERHDGWATASGGQGQPSFPLSDEDTYSGRVSFLWRPIERLTVELWGERTSTHNNSAELKNIFDPNPDPRQVTQDYVSKITDESLIGAAQVSYDADWATLKYIGSYQRVAYGSPEDVDRLNFADAVKDFGVHDVIPDYHRLPKSYTQEVDATSLPGAAFQWIVGAFMLHEASEQRLIEYQQTKPGEPRPTDYTFNDFNYEMSFEDVDEEKHTSYSVYGQGTLPFTDTFRLIGGARFTKDNSVGEVSTYFATPVHLSTGFAAMTGKAELEYDLAADNSVYGMWSSGKKPGGTNLNPSAELVPTAFKAETVSAFEIGSKNQFMNQTVRVNVAGFYNFYDNYQVDSEDPIPYQGGMTNVPKVQTYGFEGEASALLPYDLRFDGNFATMGGKVTSHFTMFDPEVLQIVNRTTCCYTGSYNLFTPVTLAARAAAGEDVYGKVPGKLPSFSTALSLSHLWDLANGGVFTSKVQFLYRSDYQFRIYNNPVSDTVPASHQWNLFFDYEPPSSFWHISFLIINLTDSNSVDARLADNFGVGEVSNEYIPPRQFMVRGTVSF